MPRLKFLQLNLIEGFLNFQAIDLICKVKVSTELRLFEPSPWCLITRSSQQFALPVKQSTRVCQNALAHHLDLGACTLKSAASWARWFQSSIAHRSAWTKILVQPCRGSRLQHHQLFKRTNFCKGCAKWLARARTLNLHGSLTQKTLFLSAVTLVMKRHGKIPTKCPFTSIFLVLG